MGCGGSRVSATDQEAVDAAESHDLEPADSIKVLANQGKSQKTVQFSSEIPSNGDAANGGKGWSNFSSYSVILLICMKNILISFSYHEIILY